MWALNQSKRIVFQPFPCDGKHQIFDCKFMGTNNHCAFILYQTFSLSRDILYKLKAHGPTIIASMSILQIQWVWATILYDMY